MKNVADLYPPTPMQRAMLLHAASSTRSSRQGSDTLHNQFVYELRGALDPHAFAAAWQRAVDRHDSLRTVFVWDEVQEPLQVVRQRAELEFEQLDWSELDDEGRRSARDALLARDRERGFDLARAPLMRLALARECPDGAGQPPWTLLWSSHHLILDRWCTAVVLEDVWRAYAERVDGLDAPPSNGTEARAPGRFRDYVAWVQRQDPDRTAAFWGERLREAEGAARRLEPGPSASPTDPSAPQLHGADRAQLDLGPERAEALRALARRLHVTPGTLVQAGWALALARRSGRADVVFGATVAGRPPEVPAVESIVGSLVGNVPVRVRFRAGQPVGDWLRELHREQQLRAPFEYVAPTSLHGWSRLPPTEPLFESLFVWLAPVAASAPEGLELRPLPAGLWTDWPVTVSVHDGDGLRLEVARRPGTRVDPAGLAAAHAAALDDLLGAADGTLDTLLEAASNGAAHIEPDGSAAVPAPREAAAHKPGGREVEELEMIQQMLLTEARSVLELGAVELGDNFFELGGNSLRAVHLHAQVQRIMGVEVPVLPLFQNRTLGEMAAFLARGGWPVSGELVRAVTEHGSQPPLFCVSSPEVNSIGYVLLARYLSPDQPVYLIQEPPADDQVRRIAITQIPEMTERYVEALRAVRPRGPYRLLGMCEGALLAFYAAKRLVRDGEQVEYLGVLNTFSLNTLSKRNYLRRAEVRLRYYGGRLRQLAGQSGAERRAELARVLGSSKAPADDDAEVTPGVNGTNGANGTNGSANGSAQAPPCDPGSALAAAARDPVGSGPLPTPEEVHRQWQELDWPGRAPDDGPYPGKVTVYRVKRQPYFRIRDEALGWRNHAAAVEVVRLRTRAEARLLPDLREWREGHLDILREPDVRTTAAAVQASLDALHAPTVRPRTVRPPTDHDPSEGSPR